MGPKPATGKGRARRTHSLGGCATCRRRHVKCDQVQPLCLTCKAVGVICEGYSSKVQWLQPATTVDKSRVRKSETNVTRRHLYTEQSRASMSTELTANLPSNSVDASLTEIDSWSKNNPTTSSDNLAVGPFGVLSFSGPASKAAEDKTVTIPEEIPAVPENEGIDELFPTPSTLDPLMSLDDSLQWADLFALDFGNEFLMQQDLFGPIAQDLGTNFSPSEPIVSGQSQQFSQSTTTVTKTQHALTHHVVPAPISPIADSSAPSRDLLSDVHFLLKHFQTKVIDAMAGVPWMEKSPWKSMNLANAVQTLADMTYLDPTSVKHANAANLYGLVATSARHAAAVPSPMSPSPQSAQCWPEMADWALLKAKLHLDQSMRNEFHGPRKAKYKDQLMAIISTMSACQISGQQTDTRRYMLEAERVLRLRGLAKREISRKARLLHHIYTWVRIVGESTYVIHDYNSYAPAVQNLNLQQQRRVGQSQDPENAPGRVNSIVKHNSRLDDFLRVETQHDSDLEIDEPKAAEVGLHDIHLEDSRDYPASMYLQIYGIPETWLSLVSQTTRLANVMDTLKVSNKETNVAFQNALQKRASRLENMICSFAFKTASASSASVSRLDGDLDKPTILPNQYMLQALNSALVIFFYRRIRDVNPWILQSHVDDVIRALQEFDKALQQSKMVGPGTAWPAFMAGCEALAPHRRESLLQWIRAGRAKSGMYAYKAAEETMLEVWKRRDEVSNGPSPRTAKSSIGSTGPSRTTQSQWTWVDHLREQKLWLMLS